MSGTLTVSTSIDGISLSLPVTITSTGTITSAGTAVIDGNGYGTLGNAGEINGGVIGIDFSDGGMISNALGGEIYGVAAVDVGGHAQVENAGIISGLDFGIILGTAALTNDSSGTISGGAQFITGTLINEGTIARATGDIVYFGEGGTVMNLGTAAALAGGAVVGVVIAGAPGLVDNQGSISGVSMLAGGAVSNAGYIATGHDVAGIMVAGGAGDVSNTGHIVGVALAAGGDVSNAAGGIISGYVDGVDLAAGGTVINDGKIAGTGGRFSGVEPGNDGVSLSGSATLLNAGGARIAGSNVGIMIGGASTGAVTLTNYGTIIGNKGIVVDAPVSATILDYGTITGTGGTAIQFENGADTLILEAGAVVNGIIVGGSANNDVTLTIDGTMSPKTDWIDVAAGANLVIDSPMAAGQTIAFAGTDAMLLIGDTSNFKSQIDGMNWNDTIDLVNQQFGPATTFSLTTGNVLEVIGGGETASLQLDPTKYYDTQFFHISSDGLNGTDVAQTAVPCFLADTRIATDAGDVAVQALRIGDLVMTGGGVPKPVKWIGRRSYVTPQAEDPDVIPVLIERDALAPGIPAADLHVSPRHALRVEGFLVPAGTLINGKSVRSCPEITRIDYYHIELEAHDTVLANGAEAETFIDADSRKMFDNADEFYRLYPASWSASFTLCAPRLEFGAELEAVRRKVALRAGLLLDQAVDAPVIGFLEAADRRTITGWAYAPTRPNVPVALDIMNRGAMLARTVANMPRPDVRDAGFGHGRCGFSVTLPAPLPALMRHEISVRPAGGGAPLAGAPVIIDPGVAHDLLKTGALANLIDAAVQGLGSGAEIADLGHSLEATGRRIWLKAQPAPRPGPPAAMGGRPVALFVDAGWPTVTRDAGSNAIISHVDGFLALGYAVAFCVTGGAPVTEDAAEGLLALRQRGVTCHGQDGVGTEATLRALAAERLDVVYLHRLAMASAYAGLVRQHAPRARIVYAVADLHHLRLARQAELTGRPDLAAKARSVKAAELWAMQLADCVITHSRFEAAYLRREAPGANVHVVPWAVDVTARLSAGRNRRDIAFIGGAGHAPNLDAVAYLAREIMPLVWARQPDLRCLVAGPCWAGKLFGTFDPRMVNLGHQPELAPLLRAVRLTVAPLRFGAGIKGKVLASAAAGTPCVMTEIAAEGLPLDAHLQATVGDGAAFAENIRDVYEDKKRHRVVARAGLDMIETSFSKAAVIETLALALGGQLNTATGRTTKSQSLQLA